MKFLTRKQIEIIGIFGVVASLLFVGAQLYFDRQVALGQQYQDRSDSRMANLRIEFDNDKYVQQLANIQERLEYSGVKVWQSAIDLQSDNLDEELETRLGVDRTFLVRQRMIARLERTQVDNNYYQYQKGLLSEEWWKS